MQVLSAASNSTTSKTSQIRLNLVCDMSLRCVSVGTDWQSVWSLCEEEWARASFVLAEPHCKQMTVKAPSGTLEVA